MFNLDFEYNMRQVMHWIRIVLRFVLRVSLSLITLVAGIISLSVTKLRIKSKNKKNRGLLINKNQTMKEITERPFEQNILISGSNSAVRAEFISDFIFDGNVNLNDSVIIIHMNDNDLSGYIKRQNASNLVLIDNTTHRYDPFFWRTDDEIITLISDSLSNNNSFNNNAMSFIKGMLLYIRASGGRPTLNSIARCPYAELIEKTNENINTGRFSESNGEKILRYLIAGSQEIQVVSNYFNRLYKECSSILCASDYMNSVDLKNAVDNKSIFCIDVSTAANNILLNILFSQIRDILRYSPRTRIVLDNLNISSSESKVQDLIRICNNNLLVSSNDLYTMLSGDTSLFDILVSRSNYNIVFQHNNATSSDKWSEKMGSYEKLETDFGFGDVFSIKSILGLGKHMHVSKKSERVVKPEEIQRLQVNQMYIMDNNANTLTLSTLN